ncbi:glycosyltransferase [Dyella silvatica]|uniref:glycosyltransferase n=1 Tax=Dyella silvatica TaxID=2992128 RepID=UPI00225913C0|nr:glycosyltransferase [Dyella silvatica]
MITNNTLDARAGSELYVRDIALALLKRGHQPIAYSSVLGTVANELRAATVPVVDDLAAIALAPDIIHGQHHLDAMAAMLHFPDTPAIYFCHGWIPWEEMAPAYPTIRHYIAVDDLCVERLHSTHGIDPNRIRVIRNFVDLQRFKLRDELPAKARRALIFSNYVGEGDILLNLRQACAERGIELDQIGLATGRGEQHPERVLGQYDIVFAKARCALEALACGTAVIACDAAGLGEMVTPRNYENMRRLNFGIRCLRNAHSAEAIGKELDRYNAAQSREVSLRIRAEANIEDAIDLLLSTYQEALADPVESPLSKEAYLRPASRYLSQVASAIKARAPTTARALIEAEAASLAARARAQQAERYLAEQQLSLLKLNTTLSEQQHQVADNRAALSEQQQQNARISAALSEQQQQVALANAALSQQQQQAALVDASLSEERLRSKRAHELLQQERLQRESLEQRLLQRDREIAAIHRSTLWPLINGLYRLKERLWNTPLAAIRARKAR